MAKALRDIARTVAATSRTHFDVASIRRSIARWESSDERTTPGDRYQYLLGLLFARTPSGAIDTGAGSDFATLLTALRHFGIPSERIQQLTTLVTHATASSPNEASGEIDSGSLPASRSTLARVSIGQLKDLLTHADDLDQGRRKSSSPSAVPPSGATHPLAAPPDSNAHNEMLLPVIVNGRLVAVPLGGATEDDDTMSPLNRRSIISCGLTAAATAALSTSDAAPMIPRPAAPATLGVSLASRSWAGAINEAVLNPTDAVRRAEGSDSCVSDGGILRRGALRAVVDRAMRISLTSDYGALEQSLPALIGQVEAGTLRPVGDERVAHQALSDVYAVAGWTLIKADMPTGAWIAAQRAIDAAERADDIPRLAAATRCLAEVHMRAGNLEAATRTAFLAAIHLDTTASEDRQRDAVIRGAALLSAAAASARRGDTREAHTALKAAAACAGELGQDRAVLATVFGPTNVAIHQVAIAIELGEAREAVRHIPAVRLNQMPKAMTERRSRFLIDVARSYAQIRDDQAAIGALAEAEKIAPDELRNHRLTRKLVPELLTREHRSSDLRGLAQRCNLLA